MTDSANLIRLIKEIELDKIYNLTAMSHVNVSFDILEYVADVRNYEIFKGCNDTRIREKNKNLPSINL